MFEGFVKPKKDAGGTNTGDATATAADIQSGVTAYVKGVKVTGTSTKKKWATGITSSIAGNTAVTINNLDFTPSKVTMLGWSSNIGNGATASEFITMTSGSAIKNPAYATKGAVSASISSDGSYTSSDGFVGFYDTNDTSISIIPNGFRFNAPILANYSYTVSFTWYADE